MADAAEGATGAEAAKPATDAAAAATDKPDSAAAPAAEAAAAAAAAAEKPEPATAAPAAAAPETENFDVPRETFVSIKVGSLNDHSRTNPRLASTLLDAPSAMLHAAAFSIPFSVGLPSCLQAARSILQIKADHLCGLQLEGEGASMGFHAIRSFFGGRDAGVKFVNFKPVGVWLIRAVSASRLRLQVVESSSHPQTACLLVDALSALKPQCGAAQTDRKLCYGHTCVGQSMAGGMPTGCYGGLCAL